MHPHMLRAAGLSILLASSAGAAIRSRDFPQTPADIHLEMVFNSNTTLSEETGNVDVV